MCLQASVSAETLSEGAKYFRGEKHLKLMAHGTNEDADYKSITARRSNILLCFTFLRSF